MRKHNLRITNPTGDAVLTTVELDGVQQMVSGFSIDCVPDASGHNWSISARLVYPVMPVEVEYAGIGVDRRYSAKLHIAGLAGVHETGYGMSIAEALRDLASRVDDA